MSAYIVDKATIDAIMTVFWRLECDEGIALMAPVLQEFGQMLWQANHESVNYRYTEATCAPLYRYQAVPLGDLNAQDRVILSRALGIVRGYMYQSCEHPGWQESEAYAFASGFRVRLEAMVPHRPSRMTMPAWQLQPVSYGWDLSDMDRATALTDSGALGASTRAL